METVTYTPADVERAQSLAEELRKLARDQREAAVDVDSILYHVRMIGLGAREWSFGIKTVVPRPTADGIKHVALVADALRSREHALTRMASALECAAIWLEETAKFNAPVAADPKPTSSLVAEVPVALASEPVPDIPF